MQRLVEYLDEGSGPAIVLLHGFSLDRTMWDEQRLALCTSHRVLAIDLPGHGASASMVGEHSPAREVLRCLDAVGIERAVVVGSSLGGSVAIDLALERPSVVRSVVLLDPILFGATTGPNPEQAALAEMAQAGDLEQARARWLARPSFEATLQNPRAAALLRAMLARYEGGHWLGRVRDEWLHAPHTERIPCIALPVSVVVGARGGPRGVAMARETARLWPGARLEVLDDTGHLVALESPDYLSQFLRSVLADYFGSKS
jgi:pimeloyl-ACP methyl ester carboxylesterase